MTALVFEPMKQKDILSAIGDPICLSIIRSVMIEAKTLGEIIKESDLSQTSCYRKINILLEKGLIVKCGIKVIEKKYEYRSKAQLYKSFTKQICVIIKKDEQIINTDNDPIYFKP